MKKGLNVLTPKQKTESQPRNKMKPESKTRQRNPTIQMGEPNLITLLTKRTERVPPKEEGEEEEGLVVVGIPRRARKH